MSLTLNEMMCINCREHKFSIEDFIGKESYNTAKRGAFAVPAICPNCEAVMSLVVFDHRHSTFAIAYECTNNDEPCYDEDCEKCIGNGNGWTGA